MLDIMKRAFAGEAEPSVSRRSAMALPAMGAAAATVGVTPALADGHVAATYMPPSDGASSPSNSPLMIPWRK